VWVFAAVLLAFSTVVGIVGATEPFPTGGFKGYTALDATRRLFTSQPSVNPEDALVETVQNGP
jgi:hypothetical protein